VWSLLDTQAICHGQCGHSWPHRLSVMVSVVSVVTPGHTGYLSWSVWSLLATQAICHGQCGQCGHS